MSMTSVTGHVHRRDVSDDPGRLASRRRLDTIDLTEETGGAPDVDSGSDTESGRGPGPERAEDSGSETESDAVPGRAEPRRPQDSGRVRRAVQPRGPPPLVSGAHSAAPPPVAEAPVDSGAASGPEAKRQPHHSKRPYNFEEMPPPYAGCLQGYGNTSPGATAELYPHGDRLKSYLDGGIPCWTGLIVDAVAVGSITEQQRESLRAASVRYKAMEDADLGVTASTPEWMVTWANRDGPALSLPALLAQVLIHRAQLVYEALRLDKSGRLWGFLEFPKPCGTARVLSRARVQDVSLVQSLDALSCGAVRALTGLEFYPDVDASPLIVSAVEANDDNDESSMVRHPCALQRFCFVDYIHLARITRVEFGKRGYGDPARDQLMVTVSYATHRWKDDHPEAKADRSPIARVQYAISTVGHAAALACFPMAEVSSMVVTDLANLQCSTEDIWAFFKSRPDLVWLVLGRSVRRARSVPRV